MLNNIHISQGSAKIKFGLIQSIEMQHLALYIYCIFSVMQIHDLNMSEFNIFDYFV